MATLIFKMHKLNVHKYSEGKKDYCQFQPQLFIYFFAKLSDLGTYRLSSELCIIFIN